ncbi:hypothetical protein Hanom_Chr00s000003g01604511 [Helianthus anomalus]
MAGSANKSKPASMSPRPPPGLKHKPQGPRPNPSPSGMVAWTFSPNPCPNPSPITHILISFFFLKGKLQPISLYLLHILLIRSRML